MTKRDIIRRIADELRRTAIETTPIVQKTLDAIINVLAEEGRVELRNFGVFLVKKRKAGRAATRGPARRSWSASDFTVKFKPGRAMDERVAMKSGGQGATRETASDLKGRP